MRTVLKYAFAIAAAISAAADTVNSGTRFVEEALRPFVERGELPGAISVFYNDGVQEMACVGYADIAAKRPITMDDAFMQCSQTKGFCGVTIAMLVEEGKISLDDPVSKYLPEFKTLWVQESDKDGVRKLVKAKNTLTIRMVMNHTGGFDFELPNYVEMGGWSRRMPLRSVAAIAASIPLKFEPGTQVAYSNVGIDIGAAVVEWVSRMRWERFLEERLFKPLGMDSSTFWPDEKQQASKIEFYGHHKKSENDVFKPTWWRQSHLMQRPYGDDRVFPSAGAGLWTTARDQLKFYKMLMNLGVGENGKRILKEDTVKSILAVSTRPRGMGGYSLGLAAPEIDNENQWFGHGGAWGTSCMVNWHKKQLKMWVVQLWGEPQPWNRERDRAADRFFKVKIDNKGADAYTGRLK